MGNFYVNFAAHGTNRDQIVACLEDLQRNAYIAPMIKGVTVFYDREADRQDDRVITEIGSAVSMSLKCSILAVINHDDDILYYRLFQNGVDVSEYDSCPGYFDDGDTTPIGADAEALCIAFGRNDSDTVDEVDAVLTEEEDYVFAMDRHKELVSWLGISWKYACMCYRNIQDGNLATGTNPDDFEKTRVDSEPAATGEVSLTVAAADAVNQAMLKSPSGSFLRVAVKAGGKTGFKYDLDFDTQLNAIADCQFESCGVRIVVDKNSLRLLAGTIIDYKTGAGGTGFVFQNPNAE
jgi:iron-sulfur cluster assembly protein